MLHLPPVCSWKLCLVDITLILIFIIQSQDALFSQSNAACKLDLLFSGVDLTLVNAEVDDPWFVWGLLPFNLCIHASSLQGVLMYNLWWFKRLDLIYFEQGFSVGAHYLLKLSNEGIISFYKALNIITHWLKSHWDVPLIIWREGLTSKRHILL